MGALAAKPNWVDGKQDGKHKCDKCNYATDDDNHLNLHKDEYHNDDKTFVLYMACDGSIEGRNILNDNVSAKWIDCTGGQAAYEDNDLKTFGEQLVKAARDNNIKLYHIYRLNDPGLGLDFPYWWVQGGLRAGVFDEYPIPEDVKAE